MIEYILIGVKQSAEKVVLPLLKKKEDYGFRYIIPKSKNVPKKILSRYIVQQIYNSPTPGSIVYSEFYHSNTDVMALRDITTKLDRSVYIINRYTIK